jgi:hypothetical protein
LASCLAFVPALRFLGFGLKHIEDDSFEPRRLGLILLIVPLHLAANDGGNVFWQEVSSTQGEELMPAKFVTF